MESAKVDSAAVKVEVDSGAVKVDSAAKVEVDSVDSAEARVVVEME